MKIYILKKDLPWAEAGSEWEWKNDNHNWGVERVILKSPFNEEAFGFPKDGFSDWFEEKKPEVTFTPEQIEVISKVLRNSICHSGVDTVDTFLKQIRNYTV